MSAAGGSNVVHVSSPFFRPWLCDKLRYIAPHLSRCPHTLSHFSSQNIRSLLYYENLTKRITICFLRRLLHTWRCYWECVRRYTSDCPRKCQSRGHWCLAECTRSWWRERRSRPSLELERKVKWRFWWVPKISQIQMLVSIVSYSTRPSLW